MKLILTEEEKLDILEQYMGKAPVRVKQGVDFSRKLENIKPGESWFYQNKCLTKRYPNLNPTGAFATLKLGNGDTIAFQQGGKYFYSPKSLNPNDDYLTTHDERRKTGQWWCDTNDELKIDTISKPQQTNSTIPKASSMEDVRTGKGYVIKNMRGPVVKELQDLLIKVGYLKQGESDSIFGDDTHNAVVKFQKDSKIVPKNNFYGIFGLMTYNALANKLKELGK